MTDSVTIRHAVKADLPTLGRLGASLVRAHYAFDRDRFMAAGPRVEEGYAWFLGRELEAEESVVLVAERNGEVVGYVYGYVYGVIEPRSWKELREVAGFISDVVVDEPARRSGIAAQLVEAAAAWLEEHGAPRIMLWTAEKNPAAQRLFERLGFRRTMVEMTRERSKKL
jgi:ribosomal protein S18 acetylase RimI-like enzyme